MSEFEVGDKVTYASNSFVVAATLQHDNTTEWAWLIVEDSDSPPITARTKLLKKVEEKWEEGKWYLYEGDTKPIKKCVYVSPIDNQAVIAHRDNNNNNSIVAIGVSQKRRLLYRESDRPGKEL